MGDAMSDSKHKAGGVAADRAIAIAAPGKMPYLVLGGLLSIAPIAIVMTSLGGLSTEIPVERLPVVLGFVLMIELPIAALLIWLMKRRRVEIVGDHLEILAALYRRRVALSELDLDGARIVDLRERRECRPRLRSNGIGLPGFLAGHFRDAKGRKMFCLRTQPRNLWIGVSDGSLLLLAAENPSEALNRLRRSAGSK
jgi:hypothetical protein